MTNRSHRVSSMLRWMVLGAIVLWFPWNIAHGSETLTDFTVLSQNDRVIQLFPGQHFTEMMVSRPTNDLVVVDLPFFTLESGPQLIVGPHPKVQMIRITQASRSPDVVRVAMLFQKGSFTPVLRDGKLLFESGGAANSAVALAAIPAPSPAMPPAALRLPPQTTSGAQSVNLLDEKVNLHFDEEDLGTILNALAMKFGLHVVADSGVRGKFTVHAQEMSLREVLKNLLLQRNFQYTLKNRELTVISLGQGSGRMARELLFKDLSLKDALQTLSKMMNVNLIIHESVKDKSVNFYVENLNLDELFDLLIQTNDLVKKPHNDNTFVILSKEEAKKYGDKTYRTFKLTNAKPDEIIKQISSSKSLADKIDTGNISINDRINAMSVYDTPENLELIQSIIDSNDEKVKQAVIEVKLIEINRTALKQLGVSLDNYSIKVGDIAHLPQSAQLPATLEFLESESKAKVLASPKIRAIHGKKATIQIGEIIPVPYFRYEISSSTFLGALPQTYKEYRDVDVGIELSVTPEISRDNEITLEMNTKVDSVLDINSDGQIHKSNRSTNTTVRIKDGETVVLGGLIKQNDSTAKQSPSMLNRVPLLRSLMTQSNVNNVDSEMIMLVTPHLVNLDKYDTPDQQQPGLLVQKIDARSAHQ